MVQSILIDLAQRETMNLSARFAADLIAELDPVIKLQRRHHRFAGFAVLKAPDVPSILLEMGYLSNKADLKLLKTPSHRKKTGRRRCTGRGTLFCRKRPADPVLI